MSNFDEKKGGQHVGTDAPTYQRFARDKRVRTTSAVKVEPVSRRENAEDTNREGRTFNRDERSNYKRSYNNDRGSRPSDENRPRASYNPNFTRDNRPAFRSEESGEERPRRQFNRDFNRDGERRTFNRDFNRDGEQRPYNRERRFNSEDRPQRSFNRDYNRDSQRDFNRSESRTYNSFRSESGEERPRRSFNRNGEERPFNRDFNRDGERRTFNRSERPSGYRQRDEQGGFRQRDERPARKPARTKSAYSEGEIPESYPRFAAPKQEGEIRLNRYIAQSGLCSRREADELIADGKTHLRIDYMVSGLGSNACGPKLEPQYRLSQKNIHFRFQVKPRG
jgi:23S rRNA pseudouridine2605 synthase